MKRKLMACLSIVLSLTLLCNLFPVLAEGTEAVASSSVQNVQQKAEYLLDENFTGIDKQSADVYPSGWDVSSVGGALSFATFSWFKISDTNSQLPVTMSHNLSAQTSGVITFEYRFKQVNIFDGVGWQLCGGNTIGCGLYTSGGNIYAYSSDSTPVLICSYTAGTEYGVKILADITAQTFSVYINGSLKVSDIPFAEQVTSIDKCKITTGVASTGEMYLATVKIYKGYAINERFITTMTNLPSDWNTVQSGGSVTVEKMDNESVPDYYSLRVDATNAIDAVQFTKSITALSDTVVWEYKAYYPAVTNGSAAALTSGGNPVLTVTTQNSSFYYSVAGGQPVSFYNYIPNMWYSIRIKLNTAEHTADIYLNGKLKAQNITIPDVTADTAGFYCSQGSGVTCIDDIALYCEQPLPADYVPVPNKVTSSDGTLVGVQSCSIWREGSHFGWDKINPYPERIPIQGFYDEGNPEEADLEIKWMAEHGIDYQFYCWYRPGLTKGKPIKDPDMSMALHEGYFKSQYSNYLKFAIMWENLGASTQDSADFRNNIVPYWIEYYFKDSRYLTIENKPVISIYNLGNLVRDFGSVQGARAEMDYLRQACQAAGFDDIILLSVNTSNYNIQDFGVDAVYNYSWGSQSGYPDAQKANLLNQRDKYNGNVIATVSMGRDDSAWGREPGYYSTAQELADVASWTKNTLMPSLPENSVGRKMVIFDNWNEFGEGHFIMPTSLNGFGYLDSIRNVFTEGGTHQDSMPNQEQKNRLSLLYPQNRVIKKAPAAPKADIPTEYIKQWDFNTDGNNEGWDRISDCTNGLSVENGTISFISTGNDPWIMSPDSLGFSGDESPYIHLRMKNSSNDTSGRIYFITESDQVWEESKGVGFTVKANDSDYTDYYIYMWQNAKWAGKIKAFRIDPSSWTGNISIDSIGVTNNHTTDVKVMLDGQTYRVTYTPKVIDGCPMLPAAEILKKLGGKIQQDNNNQFTLVKGENVCILTTDSLTAMLNGTQVGLESAAVISNDTLYIPASLLKMFNFLVSWDGQNQVVGIYTSGVKWDFSSLDGWTANEAISNVAITNGCFTGNVTGGSGAQTPSIIHDGSINIEASAVKRIRLGYWNGLPGDSLSLSFITTTDSVWDAAKTITVDAVSNDSGISEYVFDTSSCVQWSGIIKQIRLELPSGTGSFSLNYVNMETENSIKVIGDNMLVNPGMETDVTSQFVGYSITQQFTNSQGHSGMRSLKISKQSKYGSENINVGQVNGQEYYYSTWVKLDPNTVSLQGTSTPPVMRICLNYKVNGVNYQKAILTSGKLSSTAWTKVEGYYTLKESGTVTNLYMYMYTDNPAANDIYYLDDVEIRPVTYTQSPEWIYVSDISLNKTSATVGLGNVQLLTAAVQPVNAINREVKWSSDNMDVAVVDNYGYVYGKSEGTANITATTVESGKKATCTVTVKEGAYDTVILTVKPDGTGDFLSPKLANDSITDSSSAKQYIIEVYPGVYTEKNWTVKAFTTLRGTDRETCWLKGENPENAINSEISGQSTIWLKSTSNLENLTITCKNMRYPVHSEDSGNNKDAVHNVTNCYIEHYGNVEAIQYRQKWGEENPGVTPPADMDPTKVWGGLTGGSLHAWGYGSASGVVENFYNSTFVSMADGWYVHNNQDFTSPQINTINDSKIVSTVSSMPIEVQSLGSGTKDQVIFNNCEITGTYMKQSDWPWITQKPENQYANHAEYTVTLNNCTPIGYMDGHRGRALAIFSNSTGNTSYVRVSGDAVNDILGQYITKDGGGALKGYIYGYWDISGIKVGLNSDITVNNTLGKRLGNCTTTNKTLNITFEDGTTKSIVFNEDYTEQTNAYIIGKINDVLESCGTAAEYNVTANEYYPQVIDKQMTMTNNTNVGIPRFSAVCYNSDTKSIRFMKPTDSADIFLGITLEGIAPGQSGRVLTEGIMHKTQLNGFSGSISAGTQISVSTKDGCFAVSTANPVMKGISTNWAYFKGNTSLKVKVMGDNLIEDPGMETASSTQITGWETIREYTTQQKCDGNQSMKVSKQKNYGNIQFQTQKQVVGQEYYYSAWLKLDENTVSLTNNPPNYPVARICLQYNLNGVSKQVILLTSTALSSTEWRQIQGTYTLNEAGTVTDIRMFIYTDNPAALDTYYLDNVEIRPVTYITYANE